MAYLLKENLYSKVRSRFYSDFSVENAAKRTLNETVNAQKRYSTKKYDVFLSHSSKDASLILGVKYELEEKGFSVYVDWIDDSEIDRSKVTAENAAMLRDRMRNCNSLIYVYTKNATQSKWMPWELGYFDGYKGTVAILPVLDSKHETFKGVEFVGVYPVIELSEYSNYFRVNEAYGRSPYLSDWIK
ncbi:toll/interleukin-1 receptor domain-containing protein [Marinoscillum sp.]|uniref:toll/interleukin-1 receptor domain-containing protein n=1 Tax=Marinoscillum sp. TaxID=2024838 RepID=UPI003BAC380A